MVSPAERRGARPPPHSGGSQSSAGPGPRPSVRFWAATVRAAAFALSTFPPLSRFSAPARAAASTATWTSVAVSLRRLTSMVMAAMATIAASQSANSAMAIPRSCLVAAFMLRRIAPRRSDTLVVEHDRSVHREAPLAIGAARAESVGQDREQEGHATAHVHLHGGRGG